ncbi:FAD-dependent oxidoreductase [Oceaniserpentilla sp. 4NH20-0058]|uniref:GMC family oxidoreductase n=1 Tax=Oceaniserpentilla sp. 4NH20-0058 TaxID=3127660 RepID=UPI003109F092
MNPTQFDYIIVGAGSAGCVLANRLSENPNHSVCLIEAGKQDNNILIKAPFGLAAMVPNNLFSWGFETTEQAGLNKRKGFQPRGKVLGGSSSINAMMYVRGNPWDYDNWAALGNTGWGYEEVLPYFKKAENNETFQQCEYHGNTGPLNVAELRSPSPLNETFMAACQLNNIPYNSDVNGKRQLGCRLTQVTQKNGERCSTANAYLHPALTRNNLTVITQAQANKVLFEGKTATGVEVTIKKQTQTLLAKKEVILSGGAYGSPQLLMLSGVGNAEHLKQHGIAVVHDLPGVGENLQDHITTTPIYRSTTHKGSYGFSVHGCIEFVKGVYQWITQRKGMITTNFAESLAFAYVDSSEPAPDIELEFLPGIVDDHNRTNHGGHGYSIHATLLRPKSVGSLKLKSNKPSDGPLINPNFLSEPDDLNKLAKGLQLALNIMESAPFAAIKGKMIYPLDANDFKQLKQYCQEKADTEYHPVGTCKMGPDSDPMAVVDHELKVKGIKNLRVIDASIMPNLVSGNTNAPTIMISEKGADMILAGLLKK